MTGFPWIDACMRQLKQEGWIHDQKQSLSFFKKGESFQHYLNKKFVPFGYRWELTKCYKKKLTLFLI